MENKLKVVSYCTTWWSMFLLNLLVYSKVWTNFSTGAVTSRATKMWTRAVETCHEIAPSGLFRLQTCQINLPAPQCLGVRRLNLVIHSSVRKSSSPFPWFPPQLACPACLETGELGRFYSDISAGGLRPNSSPSNVQLCRAFIKHTPLCTLCQPVALGAEVF